MIDRNVENLGERHDPGTKQAGDLRIQKKIQECRARGVSAFAYRDEWGIVSISSYDPEQQRVVPIDLLHTE